MCDRLTASLEWLRAAIPAFPNCFPFNGDSPLPQPSHVILTTDPENHYGSEGGHGGPPTSLVERPARAARKRYVQPPASCRRLLCIAVSTGLLILATAESSAV